MEHLNDFITKSEDFVLHSVNAKYRADVVVHTCNLSYSGGGDWEDGSSRTAQEKMLVRFHLNK
jgi:hypothetical protein